MTQQHKDIIMAHIEEALETNPYGRIVIELRGPNSPVDVVVESRTRCPVPNKVPVQTKPVKRL